MNESTQEKRWPIEAVGTLFRLARESVKPESHPDDRFNYYSIPGTDITGSFERVLGKEIGSNKTKIEVPTILVSKLNPRKPRVILVDFFDKNICCVSTEFMCYQPREAQHHLDFYKWYFVSDLFHSKLQIVATGSTNSHVRVSPNETLKWNIPCPPLTEQKKIATILTSVDTVIEKTQAQIDKLNDLKTGMMQELLTKGIGPDGKPHTEFKDSPVGRIPVAWECLPLSSLVVSKGLQTGPFGSQLHSHEYTEHGIPVVMPKDMKQNRISTQSIAMIPQPRADKLEKHKVKHGDILFSRRGDIGRFALVLKINSGWICGTGCLRARLSKSVSPEYIDSYLTLEVVIDWLNCNAVGQTMLNLNTAILGELPVAVPPLEEQNKIALSIEALRNSTSSKLAGLYKLKSLKKALMQDLLTGKVRVTPDPE